MGYDHAEKKDVPLATSSSSSSRRDEILFEKPGGFDDRRNTVDTENTSPDDRVLDAPEGMLELRHTHTHHLGKLTLRGVDDDDPSYEHLSSVT